jgi:hypothetical protein
MCVHVCVIPIRFIMQSLENKNNEIQFTMESINTSLYMCLGEVAKWTRLMICSCDNISNVKYNDLGKKSA